MPMPKQDFSQIYFYEFTLGRTAAQTARNINLVWGRGSVSESAVQRWFQKFRADGSDRKDAPNGKRPPALDDDQLLAMVEADPHTSTRALAEELNVDRTTIVRHLKRLGKVKKLNRWFDLAVNDDQLKAMVEADPHKPTRVMAEELKIDRTTVVRHLKRIGKVKKCKRWINQESVQYPIKEDVDTLRK